MALLYYNKNITILYLVYYDLNYLKSIFHIPSPELEKHELEVLKYLKK
jgi:hypothetical protein